MFVKPPVWSFSTSRYGEPTTFGEFVRKARREKGLRQRDLAKAARVDEFTVLNWERYAKLPTKRSDRMKAVSLLPREFPSRHRSSFELS